MASRVNSLKLKTFKEINMILSKYFVAYCVHGQIVSGIPLNTGSRVKGVITNEAFLSQFSNFVVKDPFDLKSFLDEAKTTKSEKIESNKSIDLIYHESDGSDIVYNLKRYTSDLDNDVNTKFHNSIFTMCHNGRFGEGTRISGDTLDAIANKKFVCVGGVILAKSELPLTNKCDNAFYWNLYGDNSDTMISDKQQEGLDRNYMVIKLVFEDLVLYKLVAYAFPATEFNM